MGLPQAMPVGTADQRPVSPRRFGFPRFPSYSGLFALSPNGSWAEFLRVHDSIIPELLHQPSSGGEQGGIALGKTHHLQPERQLLRLEQRE
jgi:hypothetical protein